MTAHFQTYPRAGKRQAGQFLTDALTVTGPPGHFLDARDGLNAGTRRAP